MQSTMQGMLDDIAADARITAGMTGKTAFDQRVMDAIACVPREDFVPADQTRQAYINSPLAIGHGQTISQPYIVALMTDLAQLTPQSVVFEVGAGSGYQAAILSLLAKQVFSIERIETLAKNARERLTKLGYANIETHCGDGYHGWPEKAPFDATLVTAAASHIPPALVSQLKPGGRMIIPIGLEYMPQELMLVTKDSTGETEVKSILGVAFVPLITDSDTRSWR